METGIELISKERQEQLGKHRRPIEQDALNNPNREMRDVAVVLVQDEPNSMRIPRAWQGGIIHHALGKNYKERLIIAGALIAAEIDRINHKV